MLDYLSMQKLHKNQPIYCCGHFFVYSLVRGWITAVDIGKCDVEISGINNCPWCGRKLEEE